MPPARSGIADYSAALVAHLRHLVDLTIFDSMPDTYDPAQFDIALYHLGNNADHDFVYEAALRRPGIVVLHEANLHHLVADLTIRRGDWDAYVNECAFDGGEAARAFAGRVRALEAGPDYDGVPMLRRMAGASKGVIAHSNYVLSAARAAGFSGPQAVIPHGAWVDDPVDQLAYERGRNLVRERLGVEADATLIGAFGYLKPYKRIAQTLRAVRRLVKLDPRVRVILGGEAHPDLPIAPIIEGLGLEAHVRVLGYTAEADFASYIAACDIIVNLRYPTVGETSGSLLRAFSTGRPALVSDVGAFAELPDDICLKVPVDAAEEDLIFEFLNLLTSRPDVARQIGDRARAWVEHECSWRAVAQKYADFMAFVVHGLTGRPLPSKPVQESADGTVSEVDVAPDWIKSWVADEPSTEYLQTHSDRFRHTLQITPPGDPSKSILEMGAYMQITPALKYKLGYGHVRGCYYGKLGRTDRKFVESNLGETFECLIDHFDAERDRYPYKDESFDTVLCCELLEHLFSDPMHLISEINRILKPGGNVVITTPNIVSYRAVAAILESYNPGFFTAYIKPNPTGETEARHNREYTPTEVHQLLLGGGFALERLETGAFRDEPHPEFAWVQAVLERLSLQTQWRGDGIYAVGRKTGPVTERYPSWLYF